MGIAGEVWITGIGLVSSIGEGVEAHWQALTSPDAGPRVDTERFAPYAVHPLVPIELARFIPKTSDQRQMERWQRIGVYAAGLALADAGMLAEAALLDKTDLCIAAGNGDRDLALDTAALEKLAAEPGDPSLLNRHLMSGLRPTLYLGELSNLLAGNIQIVLKATGSSRTFKGEEMAGVAALEDAFRRISSGTSDIALVGGALNAEREDLLLNMELCGVLGRRVPGNASGAPVVGISLGSVGASLVVESRAHAEGRGARPYAAVLGVAADRPPPVASATAGTALRLLDSDLPGRFPVAVLSGASGAGAALQGELELCDALASSGRHNGYFAYGALLGHGIEAHFITGAALGAIALSRRRFFAPASGSDASCRDLLLTGFATWHGVGLARLAAIEGARQ